MWIDFGVAGDLPAMIGETERTQAQEWVGTAFPTPRSPQAVPPRAPAMRPSRPSQPPVRRYDEPDYPSDGSPAIGQPRYGSRSSRPDYESDYDDEYEADYPEHRRRYSDVPDYLQPGYREPDVRRARFGRPADADRPSYAARPAAEASAARAALRRVGRRRMDRQPPRDPTGPPRRQLGCHRRPGRGRRGGGRVHPVALLRRRAVRPVQHRLRAVRRRPEGRRRHRRPGHRRRDQPRWPRNSTRRPTRSATAASRWTSNPPNPTR